MTEARGWDVLVTLVRAELRDSRDLSAIGILKWLLEPIAALITYVVLIAGVFRHEQEAYPLFVVLALIPFRFFSGGLTSGMTVISSFARIIASYPLPSGVLPLVPVLAEGASFLVGMSLVIPFGIHYGTGLSLALLYLPLVFLVLFVLTAGTSYLAAVYGLYLPDYRGVAQNLVRLTFLASTGLVAIRQIPGDRLPTLFQANPLSGVFDSLRAIVIDEQAPSTVDLAYPAIVGAALLAAGIALYRRLEPDFPKEV